MRPCRQEFPALALQDDGRPRVHLDNPAGTQVPVRVINRIRDYLIQHNANTHGQFRTSVASDALLAQAHEAMADFLACSPYKFFGPHQGVLWGREDLLRELPAYRVRPAGAELPGKFETGTQNHENIAGTLAALEYLAEFGQTYGASVASQFPQFTGRRLQLRSAMSVIQRYEQRLSHRLVAGLQRLPGLKIHGITDLNRLQERVPTVSFTHERHLPQAIARHLARHNIYTWDGHAYAVELVQRLGLAGTGGVVRVGAVHYNTHEEIDQLLQALSELVF